jgi:hypothetical protein
MAALTLTDRAAVLAFLTTSLPNEDASALEALLDASAATDKSDCDDADESAVTTYRPWYIIGITLQSNPTAIETVRSAAGSQVAYRDPVSAYQALMQRQAAFDAGYCTIATGFEAVAAGGVGSAGLARSYA